MESLEMASPLLRHGWPVEITMEDTTKYGSSTVLLTSVSASKENSNELEGFPCVSPLDDGKYLAIEDRKFLLCLYNLRDVL